MAVQGEPRMNQRSPTVIVRWVGPHSGSHHLHHRIDEACISEDIPQEILSILMLLQMLGSWRILAAISWPICRNCWRLRVINARANIPTRLHEMG